MYIIQNRLVIAFVNGVVFIDTYFDGSLDLGVVANVYWQE